MRKFWIAVLCLFTLDSCSIKASKYSKHFEKAIEHELAIVHFFKNRSNRTGTVNLTTGEQVRLVQGYNQLHHPAAGKIALLVEIKNGAIAKIEKYDTLIQANRILHKEWLMETGIYNVLNTDMQGNLIYSNSWLYLPGKKYIQYTETRTDSVGHTFTEWGKIHVAPR